MARATTKTRVTKKQVSAHRTKTQRDLSPKWDGHETWSADQFNLHFKKSMEYYRLEYSGKDLKHKVINWMSDTGYSKDTIAKFKKTKDNRVNITVGALASNLLRGMPSVRPDFNDGKDSSAWLSQRIEEIIQQGKDDVEESVTDSGVITSTLTIQDRVREASLNMTHELEDAIESFASDPESFDPKSFKIINLLRGKDAKAVHARIIRDHYRKQHDEYLELSDGKCEQLKEAYSHLTKPQIRKITVFYQEILSACEMMMQEAKVNRKPRLKKAKPAEKVVAKLKYLKQDDQLKLVSIVPTQIVGAKELWVFNVKTRKIGKYVADDYKELSIKGSSIIGHNETKSIQKTLRKPETQLKDFKAAGKVALRTFLEDIKAVDIKLNGRINEDTILLKVQ